jgi:hypothetical protein
MIVKLLIVLSEVFRDFAINRGICSWCWIHKKVLQASTRPLEMYKNNEGNLTV